jgi:dienelactone hydrolase
MRRISSLGSACAIMLSLVVPACDSGAGADDADDDGDVRTDDGGEVLPPVCDFPEPALGTVPGTATLAAAPARCGQAPYTWLLDETLGDVVAVEPAVGFRASSLRSAAASEGITLERDPVYDAAVRTIAYVTQDRGRLVEATALVGYPFEPADGRTSFDVLLLLHGTSGFTDGCGISDSSEYHILGALFASMGYVVVAPDYIGLKQLGDPTGFPHPYLVGQATAIASLDAVRAVGKLESAQRGNICVTPRIVVFGGSQGGHAALWVDRLAPYYAGELELRGTIATVPPSDMLGHCVAALQSVIDATGNTIAFLGVAADWYGLGERLDEVFVPPLDVDVPAALAASCDPEDAIGTYDTLEEVFQPLLLDAAAAGTLATTAPWGCLFAENGLTTTSIPRIAPTRAGYGILFVLAEADTLVNPAIERTAFGTLCAQGMRMEMLECAGAGHVDGTFWSIPEIIDFADARMAGTPFESSTTCVPQEPVRCRGTP